MTSRARYSVAKLNKGLDVESPKRSAGVCLPHVSEEELAWADKAKGMFKEYDMNGDGCIDEDELKFLLTAISDKFTPEDIRTLMKEADADGNCKLDFSEFVDFLTGPPKMSLGRAVVENTQGLEVLFNVYDKKGARMISKRHFEECHVILQAALRLADTYDDDEHRNDELESDKEEALDFIKEKERSGMIGFLDFVDWMKQHIPYGMAQSDFYEFCTSVAATLEESFEHAFVTEKGYKVLGQEVLDHMKDKFSSSMPTIRSRKRRGTVMKLSPWDTLPEGLSIDRLKAKHMMVSPLNMRAVKDISWEVLCIPAGSSGREVWVAEVVRRVLMKTGKLKVESAEYYKFDVTEEEWVPDMDSASSTFSCIQPGLGVFCLLKTTANFASRLRWCQVQTSLEGAVDMRLIREDAVEKFNEEITQIVSAQMEEDGYLKGKNKNDQMKYVQRYLVNELELHPGMVMATLLKLEAVERDPSWEDFAEDE